MAVPPQIASALQVARNAPQGGNIANMVTGGLNAGVAGRTDHLPISVPQGAYVIPADVVSALGQGNTQAGMKVLDRMFAAPPVGPGGQPAPPVNIAAAGGEYVVSPAVVERVGNGNIDQGHAALDAWVKKERAANVKHLRSMPGPRR